MRGSLERSRDDRALRSTRRLGRPTITPTALHHYQGRHFGVEPGSYTHHVGSMHINLLDRDKVRAILTEADTLPAPRFPAPPMLGLNDADMELLLDWETALRTGCGELTVETARELPLPEFWRQVLLLFDAYRQIQAGRQVSDDTVAALTDAHRWLLAQRWPDRLRAAVPTGRPA